MKNSFVLYTDYAKQLDLLSMEQRGLLLTALMDTVSGKEIPVMDGMTQMAYSFIMSQIDRDNKKYEEIVKKRQKAGALGGRGNKANVIKDDEEKTKKANALFDKQEKLNDNDNDNDNVNDNVNDTNNKKTLCKADAVALFEKVWNIYPLKRGKGQVSEANKRRLLDIGFEELERAINRYKADLANEPWRKPQNGSTFFNSGYLDYLDNSYVKPDPKVLNERQVSQAKVNRFVNYEPRSDWDFEEMKRKEREYVNKKLMEAKKE